MSLEIEKLAMDKILTKAPSAEVAELYRLTRALLALRDLFDGAYERAVLSMLQDQTRTRLERLTTAGKDQTYSVFARPILDDSFDALSLVLDEDRHDVAESLLAAALADTVAELPVKLTAIERNLQVAES
jgi:hypothetical protein